jgi:hypothetical protein
VKGVRAVAVGPATPPAFAWSQLSLAGAVLLVLTFHQVVPMLLVFACVAVDGCGDARSQAGSSPDTPDHVSMCWLRRTHSTAGAAVLLYLSLPVCCAAASVLATAVRLLTIKCCSMCRATQTLKSPPDLPALLHVLALQAREAGVEARRQGMTDASLVAASGTSCGTDAGASAGGMSQLTCHEATA